MDTLDSRALRFTDCYAQRFMKAGHYPYAVVPVMGACLSPDRPFAVHVQDSGDKHPMRQHNVTVRYRDRAFVADPDTLTIAAGDLVLWNCPDTKAIPFTVVGEKPFFSSEKLVNESGYSHAFGLADRYEWVDAYGSGASGVIRVRDAGCKSADDVQRWQAQLRKGTLVTISGSSAEPREVDIVTGQTVFFIVTKGPGISITDRRLLATGLRPSGGDSSMEPVKGHNHHH
jgi:plastocyanin